MDDATGTILIVDDDPTIRALLEVNFELEGYKVEIADDGSAALEAVRRVRPDAVLLDVMMPELDGFAVCTAIKADPELAPTPVVFLSARAQETDVAQGHEVGAAAYVTKPFDPSDLTDLVADLVANRG